eukprot:6185566-Pleurochrysis_carterae.AAC.1
MEDPHRHRSQPRDGEAQGCALGPLARADDGCCEPAGRARGNVPDTAAAHRAADEYHACAVEAQLRHAQQLVQQRQ